MSVLSVQIRDEVIKFSTTAERWQVKLFLGLNFKTIAAYMVHHTHNIISNTVHLNESLIVDAMAFKSQISFT